MRTSPRILFLALLTAGTLSVQLHAQAAEKEAEAKPASITEVTVILRHAGSNIPGKFISYLAGPRGNLTMPLHDPHESGWVAAVRVDLRAGNHPAEFSLMIQDTSRLQSESSDRVPFSQRPVVVISLELPIEFGGEIPVYKSPNLAVSIRFDPVE